MLESKKTTEYKNKKRNKFINTIQSADQEFLISETEGSLVFKGSSVCIM